VVNNVFALWKIRGQQEDKKCLFKPEQSSVPLLIPIPSGNNQYA
jgi:hypothetical protein